MKNIMYFLETRGQKSFSRFHFNEVDSLIFCNLAYMNFDNLVPKISDGSKSIFLRDLNTQENIKSMAEKTLDERANKRFLPALFASARYKDLCLNFYRNRFSTDKEEQFSAVCILLEGEFCYVAFRGTDPTLLGWKEDFNMSYCNAVPAQKDSVGYLNHAARLTKEKLYIGGHSKGGNLAFYSAVHCDPSVHDRILKVYNHDGPGFRKEFFDAQEYKAIRSRMIKYIPQASMIGVLLNHREACRVVRCSNIGILQHDIFMWQVTRRGRLALLDDRSRSSHIFDKTMKDWLDSVEDKDRNRYVDVLFDLLGTDSADTIFDFKHHFLAKVRTVKMRYKALDEDTKSFFKEISGRYLRFWRDNRKAFRGETNAKNPTPQSPGAGAHNSAGENPNSDAQSTFDNKLKADTDRLP